MGLRARKVHTVKTMQNTFSSLLNVLQYCMKEARRLMTTMDQWTQHDTTPPLLRDTCASGESWSPARIRVLGTTAQGAHHHSFRIFEVLVIHDRGRMLERSFVNMYPFISSPETQKCCQQSNTVGTHILRAAVGRSPKTKIHCSRRWREALARWIFSTLNWC